MKRTFEGHFHIVSFVKAGKLVRLPLYGRYSGFATSIYWYKTVE